MYGEDVRPGDWRCPSCSANVFASKSSCFKCGTAKPGVGGPGGMPFGGMPSMPGMPGMHGMGPAGGAAPTGLSMPPPLPSMMFNAAAGRGGEINPVLAKQQAEAMAKMRAQQLDSQTATAPPPSDAGDDRKRMMADMHAAATESGAKRRKRRWGNETEKVAVKAVISSDLSADQQKAYLLHVQIEEINGRLRRPDLGISTDPRERSPSPEPIYSHDGKRLNTREIRTRKKLESKRHELISEYQRLNPAYRPPGDYRAPDKKITDEVPIPQDEHPHIGFMGLLIGPRGNTLKKIQKETGCKVMIRGKGTEKEGKGRSSRLPQQGDGKGMHAIIEAPTEAALKKCVNKIRTIIAVGIECPDGQNELKRMQLRELAALNGTLREDEMVAKCKNCGSFEHRTWQCPIELNFVNQTTCTRCGGKGHVAADCRVDLAAQAASAEQSREKMDSEYMAFMSELGEGAPPPPPSGAPPPPAGAPPPWASKGSGGGGGGGGGGGSDPAPPRPSGGSAPPPWASRSSGDAGGGYGGGPSHYGPPGGAAASAPPQQYGGYGGGGGGGSGGGYGGYSGGGGAPSAPAPWQPPPPSGAPPPTSGGPPPPSGAPPPWSQQPPLPSGAPPPAGY
eukprot:CAMPEP_0182923226 /NCGR_PEP_ID=MMETSP0105_2-20130417/5289_1 /TAXON_ID=81532 ORGANISM="Acanthoeca-like sp., Strain 10tr" /NCGR_SAMPLE_ID=MMETSP0105_2 /ASSEMBLY_ACC=CAM_ASM_000205 /LENGTH=617 /DNA_ID=CAMNT_0025060919 /DNA_START=69 /DNA_END=1922 /DNA_ORIENTATION=-